MRALSICLIALALGACSDDKRDNGAGKAAGEILPGSVSDAMLPLDTVRSQAPLAPKAEAAGNKAAETDPSEASSEAADPAAPPPAATEPTAE